jgi:hypothetical protein
MLVSPKEQRVRSAGSTRRVVRLCAISKARCPSRSWASTSACCAPERRCRSTTGEADEEDFLVLAGRALLIIEGEERSLRAWDLVHCPAGVSHVILGAGSGFCVVVAAGARDRSTGADWGAYPVDPVALRHRAGVRHETTEPLEAYAGMRRRQPVAFDPDWLPESAV